MQFSAIWLSWPTQKQETRNKLTDFGASHDIKEGEEYAILTNIIHQEWAEVDVKAHKAMKSLKSQNLRDHMSEAELIFTALAELYTRQIAESGLCNIFSVKVCRRFHWDDEISLSS